MVRAILRTVLGSGPSIADYIDHCDASWSGPDRKCAKISRVEGADLLPMVVREAERLARLAGYGHCRGFDQGA